MNKQDVKRRITEETALIYQIETGPWPVAKSNEYYIRRQELEDAYWRRRNLKTQLTELGG